jgi:hypothetical protein
MPAGEWFMLPEHEANLETLRCSRSAEETWWKLFQLLIPNMQNQSIESLRSQYWPCKRTPAVATGAILTVGSDYINFDAFMMPSMVFPNALFESELPNVHAPGVTLDRYV